MDGVDPLAYMREVAGRLESLDRTGIERALDDLEYLGEVLDPELQDLADGLMQRLQARLEQIRG